MAAFALELAKSTLSKALGKEQVQLNFSIGPLIEPCHSGFIWNIHQGTKKDDNSSVTVFIFDSVKNKDRLNLARNAFKKIKTLRHPLMPKFIDGAETDTQIIYATEQLFPLEKTLATDKNENMSALGLYRVAKILSFLNNECGIIHGNVHLASLFTTKAGEWKLCGLEVASSVKEDNPAFSQISLLPETMRIAPPEVQRQSWSSIRSYPVHAVDCWEFAVLVYEIYNGRISRFEDLGNRGNIPIPLFHLVKNLGVSEPTSRTSITEILQRAQSPQGYFDNPLIKCSLFLEQWSIKEQYEKDDFIKQMNTSLDGFPTEFCKFKILPELITALEFGGAGAKALTPILKIGSKMDQKEFDELIGPIIIKLFASNDRAIRVTLCDNLGKFIEYLNERNVSEKIFPNLASFNGFTDTSAIVREQTLKAILFLMPKLNSKIINNDLLRHLSRLQGDEEPGIRTNTTVCIGKIAKYLSDDTRKKVLVPAFTRGFQDPFPPARQSSLLAFFANIDYFDAAEICQRIIPATAPLAIDPKDGVRKQSLKNLNLFTTRLNDLVSKMPSPTVSSQTQKPSSPTSSTTDGWTGWALNKISSGIGSTASLGEKPTEPNKPIAEATSTIKSKHESIPKSVPITSSALKMDSTVAASARGWDDIDDGWNDQWGNESPVKTSTDGAQKSTTNWDSWDKQYAWETPNSTNWDQGDAWNNKQDMVQNQEMRRKPMKLGAKKI